MLIALTKVNAMTSGTSTAMNICFSQNHPALPTRILCQKFNGTRQISQQSTGRTRKLKIMMMAVEQEQTSQTTSETSLSSVISRQDFNRSEFTTIKMRNVSFKATLPRNMRRAKRWVCFQISADISIRLLTRTN